MNELINVNNIGLIKNDQQILKDISLVIQPQDFITIIGPNGAGKTSLLKCLIGIHTPTYGTILRNKNISIGYVPQRLNIDYGIPLAVNDFLQINTNNENFDNIISEVAIQHLLDKPLSILSGGQMQKVLLARALLQKPNLLILDEGSQGLDILGQLAFYKLLNRIYKQREISIVMVSHDLHMVMKSSTQVLCLFQKICCSGSSQKVMTDPEFIKVFGKDMADIMTIYSHQHNHYNENSYG